jgi:predicted Zn-dependent protease
MRDDRLHALRDFVRSDPDDHLSRFMLGKELLDRDMAAEAVPQLEAAIQLNPNHTASWRVLGQALDAAGRPEDAKQIFRDGIVVAERTGDLQTGKEMKVFLKRLQASG